MSSVQVHPAQDLPHSAAQESGQGATGRRATTVASILELLDQENLHELELLDGKLDRPVSEVRLIEDVKQLDELGPGTLAVLDRGLSHIADTYLFDVAVRQAVSRQAAALMVIAPAATRFSITGRVMCRKTGLALVRLPPTHDVNDVLGAIAKQVADELHVTVERARRSCEAIDRLDRKPTNIAELAALGTRLLGRDIRVGPPPTSFDETRPLAVPAVITQPDGDHFLTDRLGGADANTLVEMVLWRLAAEASRSKLAEEGAQRTTLLSVGEVLRQLVEADRATRDDLSPLARKLGIPIDGWHIVTRIEFDNLTGDSDGMLAYEIRERLARTALATVATSGGSWHAAQAPDALWLMHSTSMAPARDIGLRVQRQISVVLEALRRTVPAIRCYAGIGGVRAEASGVAGSATEARLSTAHARSARRVNQSVSFDAIGLRTTIVEWYGSPTVQKSIDALFAPLANLSVSRRNDTIEILCTYLDLGGSVARTAVAAHLHRNAVRSRLQRALELLGVDIEDPDQRLFLHLACRARRPGAAPHP